MGAGEKQRQGGAVVGRTVEHGTEVFESARRQLDMSRQARAASQDAGVRPRDVLTSCSDVVRGTLQHSAQTLAKKLGKAVVLGGSEGARLETRVESAQDHGPEDLQPFVEVERRRGEHVPVHAPPLPGSVQAHLDLKCI